MEELCLRTLILYSDLYIYIFYLPQEASESGSSEQNNVLHLIFSIVPIERNEGKKFALMHTVCDLFHFFVSTLLVCPPFTVKTGSNG